MNYEEERQRLAAEYQAKIEAVALAEAEERNTELREAIDNDPLTLQNRAHAEAVYKAQLLAARRMVALNELADAQLKKSPVSEHDPRILRVMTSMGQINGMAGMLS